MEIFRRFVIGILSSLLLFVLVANAFLLAGRTTFGAPDAIKTSLAESGAYNNAPAVIETVVKQSAQHNQASEFIDFSDPGITKAIESSLPPEFVRSSSEQAIDDTYAWLNGEANFTDISISFKDQTDEIIAAVADYTFDRVKDLPECSQLQTYQLSLQESINPAELTCEPATNLAPYKKQFITEAKKVFLFKNPALGTSALEQEFQQSIQDVPDGFRLMKQLPIWLILLSVLLAIGVVFLSDTRKSGLKNVRATVIVAGGLAVLSMVITTYFTGKFVASGSLANSLKDAVTNEGLRTSMASAIQQVLQNFYSYIGWVGGIYIVIGVLVTLGLYLHDRQTQVSEITK